MPTELFLILLTGICSFSTNSNAGLEGDQAELFRLRKSAVEALSEGDYNGASITIGKSALMANLLAQQETQPIPRAHFESLAALLRSNENIYRALALFQQSGEQIPASSGICGTISLASTNLKKARNLFPGPLSKNPLLYDLLDEIIEGGEIITELQDEFRCSP